MIIENLGVDYGGRIRFRVCSVCSVVKKRGSGTGSTALPPGESFFESRWITGFDMPISAEIPKKKRA